MFQAELKGSGCPTGTLSLVFPKATSGGGDVTIAGKMGSQCQTVVFRGAASVDFRGIRPGAYRVRLELGPAQRPVAFAIDKGSGSSNATNAARTNATQVTVVKATTAKFVGQSTAASRTRAAVAVSVALDGPAQLPASLGLRVWDPTAVEVEPPVVTWRPGESDVREFTLRLTRAAPSEQVTAWAELVRVGNVLFNSSSSSPPRLELRAPRPAFYVLSNQAVYRSISGAGGGNSNGSSSGSSGTRGGSGSGGSSFQGSGGGVALSTLGGVTARVESVAVEVRRAGLSPFGSTLLYRAVVLQATGCSTPACVAAVSGTGLLRVAPDTISTFATVSVNWTAIPTEAALGVGLQLTPIDNADLAAVPDNAISLYVYGNPYGTCPAGTVGPWQAPAAPLPSAGTGGAPAPQQAGPASGRAASVGPTGAGAPAAQAAGGQPASSPAPTGAGPAPPPRNPCNGTALFGALQNYTLSAGMHPVLSACAEGDVVLVLPNAGAAARSGDASSSAIPPSPRTPTSPLPSTPANAPASPEDGGSGSAVAMTELQVPFGQDAASVLVPLGSADETVVVLNTTCSPTPRLTQASAAGGDGGSGAPSSPAGAAAWVQVALPPSVQPCYLVLQVYGSVWADAGSNTTESGGGAAVSNNASRNGTGPGPIGLAPPAGSGPGASSMPILNIVPLRTFNVSLRPRSDPDIFSAGALSLYLLHRPSGRCLPLCGLSQPMLQVAAAAVFGAAYDAESPSQLDAAAMTLTQAIRGRADAAAQLQVPATDDVGDVDGGVAGGRRLRRWLAAWLAASWLGAADRPDAATAAAGAVAEAVVVGHRAEAGKAARARGLGHRAAAGRTHQRRVLQLGGSGFSSSSNSSNGSSTPPVPPPAQSRAPSPPPAAIPTLRPPTASPSAAQPALPQGPPPVLPALPVPAPSSSPEPSYPGGTAIAAARPPDGFDLPGGLDGNDTTTLHVLTNPEFADWCYAWESQVLDLELLAAVPYDMTLEASSLGLALQVLAGAGSGDAAAAAVLLGPSTRSELLQQGSADKQQGAAPGNCSALEPLRPAADGVLALSLVAPDGVSTAALELGLYVDYAAAAAALALQCQNNSRSTGGSNSTGTAPGSASAPVAGPAPPPSDPGSAGGGGAAAGQPVLLSLPPPVSLWSACRPCGPGSFSNTANSTSCQVCSPGSASSGIFNKDCAVCAPGTFAALAGSAACRPCYAGSYTPRPGATACTVCPDGTTSLTDGAAECVVPPQHLRGDALVVSFQVVFNVNMSGSGADRAGGNAGSVALAASASGLNASAPADWLFKMLIAADTAAALRIPPTQVRVSLMEISPSTFLVNVSATMPIGQASSSAAPGSGAGGVSSGGSGSAPSPEVDADTLINRLVDNPDGAFPRTREATGGSLQVQLVQRQVVGLDDRSRGVNVHAVLWPTLAGTAVLAVALGFACRRYCRRRQRLGRGGGGGVLSLPPISDAFCRLAVWKYPTSPPAAAFFAYGRFTSLELQEHELQHQPVPLGATSAAAAATARQRAARGGGGSKANLPALGMALAADSGTDASSSTMMSSGSGSVTADLDAVAMMYTRDALAAPRI